MAIQTHLSKPFRVEQPVKGLTIVQVAPGGTVPPHTHDEGYVVVPFLPASVERITHHNGRVVNTEPLTFLPFVPYFVEATKPDHTISLRNTGKRLSPFQKMVPEPPIKGPQEELPLEQISVVSRGKRNVFTVETAVTLIQQAVGLMFRPQVPLGRGMLFVWSAPREVVMYMRNMLVPLDLLFIDENLKIAHTYQNAVAGNSAPIPSQGEVLFTLEVPAGTVAALGITKGDAVE